MALKKLLNKSYLAPLADRVATEQLKFLILNTPFTVLVNNYKANLYEINLLRTLVRQYDGVAYQPNKNIKTRAFKELGTVLSSGSVNGLVVFIFFTELPKALKFLKILKNKDFYFLSYFSILLEGHLATSVNLTPHLGILNPPIYINSSILKLNSFLVQVPVFQLSCCLNKIYLILNAHSKSISQRS